MGQGTTPHAASCLGQGAAQEAKNKTRGLDFFRPSLDPAKVPEEPEEHSGTAPSLF